MSLANKRENGRFVGKAVTITRLYSHRRKGTIPGVPEKMQQISPGLAKRP